MNRRDLLGAVVTTGLAAMAGCSTLLSNPCDPGANALGDISIDRYDHDYAYTNLTKSTFSVRGTVLYVDDIEGVCIHDTTGCGRVISGKTMKVIDPDAFSAGDCITATGRLNVQRSEEHETPTISAEELGNQGGSDADVGPTGFSVPDLRFEVDWDDTRDPMVVRLTEGSATAGNVVVRHQPRDAGKTWLEATHDTWADLSAVAPDEEIPTGSTIQFENGAEFSVLYDHPDTCFAKQMGSTHGRGAGNIQA